MYICYFNRPLDWWWCLRHLQDYENIFLNRFVGDCIYFETLILHDIQYNMSKQENVYSLGT